MTDSITLIASDGHSFEAYLATPAGTPKAAVVVIQEIFGVNAHIKEVVDRFAAAGYLAIAPALFDRITPDITLAYDGDGVAEGRGLKEQADANIEFDVKAAIDHVAAAADDGRSAGRRKGGVLGRGVDRVAGAVNVPLAFLSPLLARASVALRSGSVSVPAVLLSVPAVPPLTVPITVAPIPIAVPIARPTVAAIPVATVTVAVSAVRAAHICVCVW